MTILRFLPLSLTVEAETKMVWDLFSKRKLMRNLSQCNPADYPFLRRDCSFWATGKRVSPPRSEVRKARVSLAFGKLRSTARNARQMVQQGDKHDMVITACYLLIYRIFNHNRVCHLTKQGLETIQDRYLFS
jgi:hypothetical protein